MFACRAHFDFKTLFCVANHAADILQLCNFESTHTHTIWEGKKKQYQDIFDNLKNTKNKHNGTR